MNNVWMQAWQRLRANRVGMVSLGITGAFLLLVALALTGVVASDWKKEVGVSFAPPHFIGKTVESTEESAPNATENVATHAVYTLDIADIDPLAPRYPEWNERAAQFKTTITVKADTLPFGADQMGRDMVSKVIKGAQVSITVGLAAALVATLIGTVLGALAGYWGGVVDDMLEWIYNVFTAIPYILLVFTFAAVLRTGPLAGTLGKGIWTVVIILGLVG